MHPLERDDPRRVGRYRLLGRLGAGGMGVVYLGRSPGGRPVAVKVVRERFAADATYRARFRREAAAARRVTGTFTAPVLDADPDAAVPWLVTAYLPGPTLREAVGTAGALDAAAVRVLAAGLAEALADVHRAGLTHRDLKPGNVVLTADGPRLIDFGIARPDDATAITRVGAVLGTAGFMSPEQASGRVAGPASDVFSLGAVLLYAATGREPFGRDDRDAVLRRVVEVQVDLGGVDDPGLAGLLAACLRKEPDGRPSAVEVLDRLGEVPVRAWPPAGLAEVIDRRAVPPDGRAWREPGNAASVVEGETVDPDAAPRLGRRALLVAVPVALAAAAGAVGAGAVGAARGRGSAPPPASAPPSKAPPPRGVPRWGTKVGDYYPKVTVTGGVVVAEGRTGDVHALDARTGEVLWKKRAGNGSHALDGAVYLLDPIQPWLVAVDAASGDARWESNIVGAGGGMAVSGGLACIGYEGPIRALDVRDGAVRWHADASAELGLAADSRVVVAANPDALVGLDPRSGRERWTRRLDLQDVRPLAAFLVGDGLVFVGDDGGVLHAVRADDGSPVWRKGLDEKWFNGSSLRLSGGVLYADSGFGTVDAVNAATGATVWSRFVDRGGSRLALSGGTLFAACARTGTVHALNAADGRVLWTHRARTDAASAPASSGGLVYLGTREGAVEAVGPPGGGAGAGS
ncbi:serine/threonine-protein kinase [Spirillospora sp. NPDC052242]